jgi:hypothetical protein
MLLYQIYRVSQKKPTKKKIVYVHRIMIEWTDFFSDDREYFQVFIRTAATS